MQDGKTRPGRGEDRGACDRADTERDEEVPTGIQLACDRPLSPPRAWLREYSRLLIPRTLRMHHGCARMLQVDLMNNRLDRPVDSARDHILGAAPRRDHAGGIRQLRLPALPRRERAHRRGAQTARRTRALRVPPSPDHGQRARPPRRRARSNRRRRPDEFWSAHVSLMTRSRTLTEDDLRAVAAGSAARATDDRSSAEADAPTAKARVDADVASSHASGVRFTPTFFINGAALRRPVGRGLVHRRDAGVARTSRARRRAGIRELGAVHGRDAAARHLVSRRSSRTRLPATRSRVLGDAARA